MSNQTSERSFGRRLWWIIRSTIASLLLIVVLAGLVYGGFLLFTEVQRSFTSLDIRLNSVERNQNLIREEVDGFRRTNPVMEAQLANLDEDMDQMQTRLSQLDETLSADLADLDEAIAELEEGRGTLTDTLAEETAVLGEAIAALQTDISANTGDIDALGGEIDTVTGSLEALDADLSDIAASQAELQAALPDAQYVQETLVLFQLWELIGRARLRLLENNIGLAADDVAAAQLRAELALADLSTAVAPADDADATEGETAADAGDLPSEADILGGVASRLALAAANLPDNPDLATADLEVAWDALDEILVNRLQPDLTAVPGPDEGLVPDEDNVDAVEEDTAEEPATDEDTAEESTTDESEEAETEATPDPTGTPAPPTATPAPSPTPSPTPSG